jgi:hypothetical protein
MAIPPSELYFFFLETTVKVANTNQEARFGLSLNHPKVAHSLDTAFPASKPPRWRMIAEQYEFKTTKWLTQSGIHADFKTTHRMANG